MSTTNAKSNPGAVSRAEPPPPGESGSAERSPYQAITISRSYEGVVRQISALIRTGELRSGERLPTERELGSAFGVSRGVVREAIKVLGALGLVEARQGSGIYVLSDIPTVTRAFTLSVTPSAQSIERLFEFRRTLETESARLAALRRSEQELQTIAIAAEASALAVDSGDWVAFGVADDAFHAAVASASGDPYLQVAVATAREMQQQVVPLVSDRAGSMKSAVAHHRAIAAAIAAHQPAIAGLAMAEHIVYAGNAVNERIPHAQASAPDGEMP